MAIEARAENLIKHFLAFGFAFVLCELSFLLTAAVVRFFGLGVTGEDLIVVGLIVVIDLPLAFVLLYGCWAALLAVLGLSIRRHYAFYWSFGIPVGVGLGVASTLWSFWPFW
jgi:hypothetical protein